ncbi:MAG: hypothetical protein PHV95_09080 [Eubacteriales bacterium]|nr:hypothetical protein [Eubacteriales bacterium]
MDILEMRMQCQGKIVASSGLLTAPTAPKSQSSRSLNDYKGWNSGKVELGKIGPYSRVLDAYSRF